MTPTRYPDNLADDLAKGSLIAFVGAGISVGAGLPNWIDLIKPLADAVSYRLPSMQDITAHKLLDAAQRYENQNGRARLIQLFRDALDTTTIEPSQSHQLLARLPIKVFFTTNYDNLLEQALRNHRIRRHVIVGEAQLTLWRDDQVQVIKLCGDLEQPDSLVVTGRDFNTLFDTRSHIMARLRDELIRKTALFVGYSLQDPFFNQLWDRIGFDFSKMQRPGYAVMFDADKNDIDDLRQRNIDVINLSGKPTKTQALIDFLNTLVPNNDIKQRESGPSVAPADSTTKASNLRTPPDFSNQLQINLRNLIAKHFSLSEMEILCSDMGVDFGAVSGSTTVTKSLSLVQYLSRRIELQQLITAVAKARPKVDWLNELGNEAKPYLP